LQDLLLPRVAQGDPTAVDACLDRYGGLIWSLACRLVPSEAEDAVQEVFVDLWQNAWRFRTDLGSETAFVSTLARRRLIDRRRRAGRAPTVEPLEDIWTTDQHVTPFGQLAASEEQAQVARCLEKLKERDRTVIELSIYEGQSQSDIADRLQTPLGTVKTLIRRALIQLRDCMRLRMRTTPSGGVLT
jgi:RNA polymerase sigma factor (sigma-70 family)